MNKEKILGIIPARYASTRFPGKPLALINDKSMIQLVYEQTAKALDNVIVATDDQRIFEVVEKFGGKAVMTSEAHTSGTERCLEAAQIYSVHTATNFDVIINVQGDEPLIQSEIITLLADAFDEQEVEIATLVNKKSFSDEIKNPNKVKVVVSKNGYAKYFSRNQIPFVRNIDQINEINFYTHIGIYAYRFSVLQKICKLEISNTEKAEKLEQNRWLENDYRIKVLETDYQTIGVDTPEDLEKIIFFYKK